MRPIKTAIIVDYMGVGGKTPEEEIQQHTERFSELLGRPLAVHTPRGPHGIEVGTELVIYDFGGLLPGCGGLIDSHTREIVRWAQDHSSGLVVVVSGFTWSHYIRQELEEHNLLDILNITCDDFFEKEENAGKDWPIPEWWMAGLPS